MNVEDINSLQERINRIALASASPYIIISSSPEVLLRKYAGVYQANKYTTVAIYNEYKNRSIVYPTRDINGNVVMNGGILHIGHVIACIATSVEEVSRLISSLRDMIPEEMDRHIYAVHSILMGKEELDVIIEGTASILVHEYIREVLPSMDMVSLQEVYTRLKGMINMAGKILSVQSIVGGIWNAYPNIPPSTMYSIISRLEHESSPYHMGISKVNDATDWYREQMEMRVSQQAASFYERSLNALLSMPATPIQMYSPEMEMERVIIRPLSPIDIVDMISHARTSADMPILIASVEGRKIIKVHNRIESMNTIELGWFMEAKKMTDVYGVMSVVIRVSRHPSKYQLIQYDNNKNHFSMNKTRRSISGSEIVTLLSSHLHLTNLRAPYTANTTYSFVTNYIADAKNGYGINRHILSWLITNPPSKYRELGLDKYVFIKEDIKPNALRDHISIHIQLGAEKLYLTLSLHDTTTGTIVPVPNNVPDTSATDIALVGFERGQRYIQVRINRAPSIHHARIAQTIYQHIISMYMEYYMKTRDTIYHMTSISLSILPPAVLPLVEREPDLRERYSYFDNTLYKYTSNIEASSLPVPIDRNDASHWLKLNHDVIRLPTVVVNNPLIKFEVAGDIWIRTPKPGRFTLVEKKDGVYIPILRSNRDNNGIPVTVNDDMTLNDIQATPSTASYVLNASKSMANKIGRLAYISKASTEMLAPILPSDTYSHTIKRIGISKNIIRALNGVLNMAVTPTDVAQYAHLCLQENWQQSVEDIAYDISSYRIEPLRHFRALENAYKINMYFILDDQLEPYLRKPPHAYFYLHRESRKDWNTIIFHSLSSEPDVLTILLSDPGLGSRKYKYTFEGNEYLDSLIEKGNRTRMVSPSDAVNEMLHTVPIMHKLGNWDAYEQIVDAYGKCRGITYRRTVPNAHAYVYATINVGFAPVQDLPLGDIRVPSGQLAIDLPQMKKLILEPTHGSDLYRWMQRERNARMLRIIAHIIWSQMDISLDEFFGHIQVKEDTVYDTSRVTHSIPVTDGSSQEAWKYFSSVTEGMINLNEHIIYVPDESTRRALYLHMKATPKMRWPSRFPSYIQYRWDIHAGRDELVFLRDADLIQYLMMIRSPVEVTQIVESVNPYILSRGDHKYLVQMVANATHAKYIARSWEENDDGPINPGYETIVHEVQYPWRTVPYDFTDRINGIHFTMKDGRIYVIIPL